ncbi:hypothetical protein [Paenibacillus aceris]|uniref:Uncharacterized protein n=1 Tax=Paenibacillus aceris TaxID=869555 RepID=A0ABS4HW49_9BACL|nr:hypothetical protein [Paenibacillus aceris]MBP1962860.1 hypothetical protein [Paenibacillus aceris]NHW38287.1 hypothetical protein [Paenibacillus aceris]
MKRFLMVLIMVFMTIAISACASSKQAADPNVSITPAPTVTPAATTAATADVSKVSASPAPTATATATTAATATATATAEATNTASPAPASSSKAPAATASDTPKASEQPASPQAAAPAPSASTPEPAQQAEVSPKGKKVLLVGRDSEPLPAEDVAIAARLKGMGFSVTHLSDRELTADATKGYDLIYVSQTTNSKFLKTGAMKEVAIPTVYVKSHGMFYLGLSSQEEGTTVKKLKSVEIVDSKHKIAGGLSGTVDVYTETGDNFGVSYGLPGKEAKVIATVPGDHAKAAVYYYDKGAKGDNGYEVKARLSYYYWSNGMQDTSTDAGWKLWDNIVLWTLQNG